MSRASAILETPSIDESGETRRAKLSRAGLMVAWIVAGALTLATLGVLSISRTQESRVLEVGREMIGAGWDGWIIPRANGEVRIHKPPLAYWMAAGAFAIFGVHDWAGRIPFAVAAWLTIGLTYQFGKELFNRRAGFYAAAMLFGSILFSHFTRRAETDTLILLFVTASIYCIRRAMVADDNAGNATPWLHALAGVLGLTILAKGPPALFVLLFFVAIAWWDKRWRLLGRFFTRGAIVTLLIIAAPWYLYILQQRGPARFVRELTNVVEGTDHFKWFWTYFADLLVATAPWCALVLHSIVEACVRWKRDVRVQLPLIWMAVVFVPLCLMGNKQTHYLLPMIPPMMLIAGWGCDLAARSSANAGFGRGFRWTVIATLAVGAGGVLALIAVPIVSNKAPIEPIHVACALILAIVVAVALVLYRKRGLAHALNWTVLGCGALVALLTSVYRVSLREDDLRGKVADLEQRFPGASYCVYQAPANLAMCFYLGEIIPTFTTPDALSAYVDDHPEVVPMRIAKPDDAPDPAPPGLAPVYEMTNDNRRYTFYAPAASTLPASDVKQ